MFNDTVTVYNKHADSGVEKWQRTVIQGVFWDSSKGAAVRKTGVSSADGLMLVIPMGVKAVQGGNEKCQYVKPKEWADLPDKAGFWTLQSGDTVILGDVSYEVVRSSKELQQFDDVINITNVDTRNHGGGMSHFEVSGR